MDKFHTELLEAETRLKYIELQCRYFEHQASVERSKINELRQNNVQPPVHRHILEYRPVGGAYVERHLNESRPSPTSYICDGCFSEITNYRWTDGMKFDLCLKCYDIISDLKMVVVN